MKNDRVCWIDIRTIKRDCVLVLDGPLVPFCSKCLDPCMRANGILKNSKKGTSLSADCLRADSLAQRGRQSTIHLKIVLERSFASGGVER